MGPISADTLAQKYVQDVASKLNLKEEQVAPLIAKMNGNPDDLSVREGVWAAAWAEGWRARYAVGSERNPLADLDAWSSWSAERTANVGAGLRKLESSLLESRPDVNRQEMMGAYRAILLLGTSSGAASPPPQEAYLGVEAVVRAAIKYPGKSFNYLENMYLDALSKASHAGPALLTFHHWLETPTER